jgi:hypothetical protein
MEAAHVLRAALAPHLHRDWSVRAGDLTWSCRETLLHAADVWYAVELASQRRAWRPPLLDWRTGLTPEEGLAAHDAAAALLAAVIRGMPPEACSYHGQPTDADGFAAMHCDEVLVHGYDIALGLGIAFAPPPDLAGACVTGCFRGPPQVTDWLWHPAPLSAWNGTRRRREG